MPARHRTRLAVFASALTLSAAAAYAWLSAPSTDATAVDRSTTAAIDGFKTSALQAKADRLPGAAAADLARLGAGLEALETGDVAGARAARDTLPATSLDRHILTWAIALRGGAALSSAEIADAERELIGWPGLATLKRAAERAIVRERPDPAAVIRMFGIAPPLTTEGTLLLARAHVALGDPAQAASVLSPLWRKEKLEAQQEAAIIREFGAIIAVADHRVRMERMLYADRITSAQRVAKLAGAEPLADAWAAMIRGDRNAAKLLDAVPEVQRSAGYLFAKAKLLRKQGKFADAAALMLKAPTDGTSLVDPDAWWIERRVLSRELLDIGDAKTAYQIAAAHAAESPVNAADAEFHAGWYALRHLNDAKAAASHFARIAEVAEGPISLSRSYYWQGRAAEKAVPAKAKPLFEQAAQYGTTFYGQLAAERLGRTAIPVQPPVVSPADRMTFSGREAVAAISRLEQAGFGRQAETLYRALAEQLTSPGELALLTAMVERRDNHFLALRLAKAAVARGVDVGALSHPIGAIPAYAEIAGAGKALAYAIARQESEFNVGAVSKAGARGLLQLMPGTAQGVAKQIGLPYSQARLTVDPAYNATLGAAFLSEQLDRFDGSYVLTFAGYNAGPGRASQWVKRYGDPRGKDVDTVVDWIERIPYTETRSYVQRVMENYQVYKMRLTGRFDIADDLVRGR